MSSSSQHAAHSDTTFRSYSSIQALEYAQRRGGYPQKLLDEVISLHTKTGGSFNALLDLGCGPGNSIRDLATHFDHAIGVDPSLEMISAAQQLGGLARKTPISFQQGDAEECTDVADNSIDLITAATSAHWFDMSRFWPTAARVLKPGGTVAFFTIWRIHCQPSTTPNYARINDILFELEQKTLGPYQKAGNWSLMGLYHDLKMPWEISPPSRWFAESSYRRQVWNLHAAPSDDGSYVSGERWMTLDEAERAIATISAVTRWREAHPELAHTEKDCVKAAFARIKGILGPEIERIAMVGPSVLVSVKKGV